MDENELLAVLPKLFASGDPDVLTGTGPDDCAHVAVRNGLLSFSVDVFAEGSHFLPDAAPEDVAAKALGASVSDLAASACRPRWALVGLCLKKGAPPEWPVGFARGLAETARACRTSIIGGDTVSSPHATFVSVTVTGEPLPGGPVLRSGGRPGDVLVVTGNLGGSILGRHLRPQPRRREIEFLMRFCGTLPGEKAYPSAAMDISDGLALDLSRMCRESGVGAFVEEKLIPISADAVQLATTSGRQPVEHALADGEDFELLLAVPPETWRAFSAYGVGEGADEMAGLTSFTRVGCLTEKDEGLRLQRPDGVVVPLAVEGYQHSW